MEKPAWEVSTCCIFNAQKAQIQATVHIPDSNTSIEQMSGRGGGGGLLDISTWKAYLWCDISANHFFLPDPAIFSPGSEI
jgi:hypothetical protein